MSTVSEVLAAAHADLEVVGLSLVTNVCVDTEETRDKGDRDQVLEEVLTAVERKKVSFLEFITKLMQKMAMLK